MKRAIRPTAGTSSRSWRSSPARSRSPATSSSTSRRSRSGRATTRSRPSSRRRRGHARAGPDGRRSPACRSARSAGVQLQNGRAVVTMNIYKQYAPIYRERDRAAPPAHAAEGHVPGARSRAPAGRRGPGRRHARRGQHDPGRRPRPDPRLARRRHAELPAAAARRAAPARSTNPAVDASAALQGTFKRFAPLNRDTRTFATPARQRSATTSAARSTTFKRGHGARRRRRPAHLADQARRTRTSRRSPRRTPTSRQALTLLPGTLRRPTRRSARCSASRRQLGPTLTELLPFAHALAPALKASRPLFHDTTPVIQNQLRPFSIAVQPLAQRWSRRRRSWPRRCRR